MTRSGPVAKGLRGLAWRHDPFAVLAGAFFCVALTVGGSSASPLSAGLTQICALPLLAWAVWRLARRPAAPGEIWPLLILAGAVAIVATQLAPLPPRIWSALPGRRTVADAFAATGVAAPWLPISLAPGATLRCGLGLVPPAAMFLAVLTLRGPARRGLAALTIAVATASVALGMVQMAQGPASGLRFYAFTNPESPVGFFANRNHQADFLAVTLPLVAWLATRGALRARPRMAFWTAAAAGYALIVVLGAAATGSRAGALLIVLGCLGAVAVGARGGAARRRNARGRDLEGARAWSWAPVLALATATLIGGGLVALSADSALARRFQTSWAGDLRFEAAPAVARAAVAFAPFGSGLGSFDGVYPMFQSRLSASAVFVNHAHDDFLETWLECGWPGAVLMAAFLLWWARGCLAGPPDPARAGSDDAAPLAGSIIIAMLLVHSTVDYPLRLPALATLFAFACGLTVSPVLSSRAEYANYGEMKSRFLQHLPWWPTVK